MLIQSLPTTIFPLKNEEGDVIQKVAIFEHDRGFELKIGGRSGWKCLGEAFFHTELAAVNWAKQTFRCNGSLQCQDDLD